MRYLHLVYLYQVKPSTQPVSPPYLSFRLLLLALLVICTSLFRLQRQRLLLLSAFMDPPLTLLPRLRERCPSFSWVFWTSFYHHAFVSSVVFPRCGLMHGSMAWRQSPSIALLST